MSYSPTLGRFLEADPIGYPDGASRYAYENDAPSSRLDSQGLTSTDDDQAFNTVVGVESETRHTLEYSDGANTSLTSVTSQPYAVFADGHRERISDSDAAAYQDALKQRAMMGQTQSLLNMVGVARLGMAKAAATSPATTQPARQADPEQDRKDASNAGLNCWQWAFNMPGFRDRPDLAPAKDAGILSKWATLDDALVDNRTLMHVVQAELGDPASPVRGYLANADTPVPPGWHLIALFRRKHYLGEIDYHVSCEDADGSWSDKETGGPGTQASKPTVHSHGFVAFFIINTPPRDPGARWR
jgi:hypothetical protein